MSVSSSDSARSSSKPPSILVVEDEALIAEEIADRLARRAYRVSGIADTGTGAIRKAEEGRPDLVLMDIRLKGEMDGIEAASLIRDRLDIPVVFLTAHSDTATLDRAKGVAPHAYILKPLQDRDMLAIEMALHRHALERRLRQSEARFSTTLASIADGVIAVNIDGRVSFANPIAAELLATTSTHLLGMPVEEAVRVRHEFTGTRLENPLARAIRLKALSKANEPVLLERFDGQIIPIEDSSAPIREKDGSISGAVMAFRDLRERRGVEENLKSTEERLRQAQKMEAIGRLAGGVAHDFNNLLTIIVSSAEALLSERSLTEQVRSVVEEIEGASERAADLTRQLLSFGRKQILQPEVVDVAELIRSTRRLLRRVIGEDIDVRLELGARCSTVRVDPSQLEQVLLNLALNARDSMPAGGLLIMRTSDVEPNAARFHGDEGNFLEVSVTDSGSGMTRDVASRAFEPFFTTKEKGKGSGLGLASAHGIITQSGGQIELESELGVGTTVRLFLPIVDEPASSAKHTRGLQVAGVEVILLVDDEDGVRHVAQSTLRRHGYRVLTARDGVEALAVFRGDRDRIDLVVTDVVMPRMGGRELSEVVWKERPDLPVLFLSGYTDDMLVRHGIEEGVSNFLQKPFTGSALARKVREVIDKCSARVQRQ